MPVAQVVPGSACVDFSRNAPVYDRRHGALLAEVVAHALAHAADLTPRSLVLDIGAGTGRVAVSLTSIGCRVVAVDIAAPMLNELRAKMSERPVSVVRGAAEHLPFRAGRFDAAVFARVAYLLPTWESVLRAAREILAPGGRLLYEWANGEPDEPWVQIREKARRLFQEAGIDEPFHPGARAEPDVDAHLNSIGFIQVAVVPIGPGPVMTLREFLGRIVSGELSYTWNVPAAIQRRCLPLLQSWSAHTFDLDQPYAIPRAPQWVIYRRTE